MSLQNYQDQLTKLNGDIWDYAELKFQEDQSSSEMEQLLRKEGFLVKTGLAGMKTAFSASYGKGKPIIGILAEFDALSGLSQEADAVVPKARECTQNGHGCGHSLLGTAACGAALGVRDYLKTSGKPGTVILFGCPAEEGGSGKTYMAREGIFNGLDAALTWHPAGGNAVITGSLQANAQVYFRFKGISSHAASAPHLGRSALDAVELMNVGVNYMREHMETTDRVHYAVIDTGGVSPNVVQSHAKVLYLIRSVNMEKVNRLYERVCKIAEGAALMTETQAEIIFDKACSDILPNSILEQLFYDSMVQVGAPQYTEEELQYIKKFHDTLTEEDLPSDLSAGFCSPKEQKRLKEAFHRTGMADFISEYEHLEIPLPGSSDVGDVSHSVPTAQFTAACFALGTPGHTWQMTAQGKSKTAVKGMLFAADVLREAAVRIIDDPSIAEAANKEYLERMEGKPYRCPIPPEVKPGRNVR